MYSAVLLDEKSHLSLSAWAEKTISINGKTLAQLVQNHGWVMYCHHMTIQYPGTPEFIKQYLDTDQKLDITHYGVSDKAIAVRVVGFHSNNKIPHITVAVNKKGGGKPVDSNKIETWTPVESAPTLKGTVKEI